MTAFVVGSIVRPKRAVLPYTLPLPVTLAAQTRVRRNGLVQDYCGYLSAQAWVSAVGVAATDCAPYWDPFTSTMVTDASLTPNNPHPIFAGTYYAVTIWDIELGDFRSTNGLGANLVYPESELDLGSVNGVPITDANPYFNPISFPYFPRSNLVRYRQ